MVCYDGSGKALAQVTHQGYSDSSAWARGQAWALYGYVVMFRETGDTKYLKQAMSIADFYVAEALEMLVNLSRQPYRTDYGEAGDFLLKHSVGHKPGGIEVDVPLIYADYYYIEALLRSVGFKKYSYFYLSLFNPG